MKKTILPIVITLIGLLIFLAPKAKTQISVSNLIFVNATPSGSCGSKFNPLRYQVNTGGLYGCVAGTWTAIGGGGGGSTFNPIGSGCGITRTSSTLLTVFPDATATTRCVANFQNINRPFTAPITVTVTGGTAATVFGYIDSAGVFNVGSNGPTFTCSGCTAVGSITAFPVGAVLVFQWDVQAGPIWATTGFDARGFNSAFPLNAGFGITCTTSAGAMACAIDQTSVPAKFFSAGTPGNVAGSTRGDLDFDTTNTLPYWCSSAGGCASSGTWTAFGGGSSSINIGREETSAVTMDGADHDIYSVSIPALGAGKCMDVFYIVQFSVASSNVIKLKWGSSTYTTGTLGDNTPFRFHTTICNIAADATHQRITNHFPMFFGAGGTSTLNAFGTTGTLDGAVLTSTQTWTSAVTLVVVANAPAAETCTGLLFSAKAP